MVDVKIRLTRSTPQFTLNVRSKPNVASSASNSMFQILDTYLYVRKVKLTPHRHMEIEEALVSSTAKYPINRNKTKVL